MFDHQLPDHQNEGREPMLMHVREGEPGAFSVFWWRLGPWSYAAMTMALVTWTLELFQQYGAAWGPHGQCAVFPDPKSPSYCDKGSSVLRSLGVVIAKFEIHQGSGDAGSWPPRYIAGRTFGSEQTEPFQSVVEETRRLFFPARKL